MATFISVFLFLFFGACLCFTLYVLERIQTRLKRTDLTPTKRAEAKAAHTGAIAFIVIEIVIMLIAIVIYHASNR